MAAENTETKDGNSVVVFGCGPVGQFAIASARLMGAGRIFAIDQVPSRLEMARAQGAEVIDFSKEDPVETLLALTGGVGPDRAIEQEAVPSKTRKATTGIREMRRRWRCSERSIRRKWSRFFAILDTTPCGSSRSRRCAMEWANVLVRSYVTRVFSGT
jgi:threonine dehydrogenase-like Zn-dependent dehydrogenase